MTPHKLNTISELQRHPSDTVQEWKDSQLVIPFRNLQYSAPLLFSGSRHLQQEQSDGRLLRIYVACRPCRMPYDAPRHSGDKHRPH